MKKTACIAIFLAILLLLPMISPSIICATYSKQMESVVSLISKEARDVVVNNETVREVIVSARMGGYHGSVRVSVPVALLNQTLSNSSTVSTCSTSSFQEELWDSVWFCLPPGPPEQYVKYSHPNHHTRYYPGLYNLAWIIPNEDYPISETFQLAYKHLHFTPGMVDDLDNCIYAFAFGGFALGAVIAIGTAGGWISAGLTMLFLALLAAVLEALGLGMQWFKDNIVRAENNDGFLWARNIQYSTIGYLWCWLKIDWQQSFGTWRDTWFSFTVLIDLPPPRSLWWGGPVGGVAGKFAQFPHPI